ncbi:MAG TPA: STAS domain-containing protein [Tepidisphaeraceae bacterium]|nr:STAS domain-containing protein [Tepidisphaeraceae bacterium]
MPLEQWSENVVVVRLADDPQLTEDLTTLEQMDPDKAANAVLDFQGVRFINSSNLAKLLKLRKKMAADSGKLILCNVGDQVWGALMVTGLEKLFTLSDNVATALATLQIA